MVNGVFSSLGAAAADGIDEEEVSMVPAFVCLFVARVFKPQELLVRGSTTCGDGEEEIVVMLSSNGNNNSL
jgi:hypothetical protein